MLHEAEQGLSGGSVVNHLPAKAGYLRDGLELWVGKIPWRRKWQPTPVSLPGKSHGQRSLVGYSPWSRKELDTTEPSHPQTHTHTPHTCTRTHTHPPYTRAHTHTHTHTRARTHTHTHGKLGIALLFTVPRGAALPHQVLTSPLLFFHALPFQEHWDPIPHVPQPVPHRLRGLSGEPVQQQHPVPVHHRQHPAAHPPDGSQSREHHQQHSPQLRLLGDGGQPGQGKQRCVPLGELCVGQPQLGETAGSSGTAGRDFIIHPSRSCHLPSELSLTSPPTQHLQCLCLSL